MDDVQAMYIKVIDSLMEIGITLPLKEEKKKDFKKRRRTLNVLYNEIIKLKKDFDD